MRLVTIRTNLCSSAPMNRSPPPSLFVRAPVKLERSHIIFNSAESSYRPVAQQPPYFALNRRVDQHNFQNAARDFPRWKRGDYRLYCNKGRTHHHLRMLGTSDGTILNHPRRRAPLARIGPSFLSVLRLLFAKGRTTRRPLNRLSR